VGVVTSGTGGTDRGDAWVDAGAVGVTERAVGSTTTGVVGAGAGEAHAMQRQKASARSAVGLPLPLSTPRKFDQRPTWDTLVDQRHRFDPAHTSDALDGGLSALEHLLGHLA
jgi:hypothetical protein